MSYSGYASLLDEQNKQKDKNKFFTVFTFSFALCLIVMIILKTVVFCSVYVDGPSMEKTLFDGDVLIANKLAKPQRGDIVIFYRADVSENGTINYHYDNNGNKILYIKRVVGMPEESVYWVDGDIHVQDKNGLEIEIDDSHAYGKTYSGFRGDKDKENAVFVPQNHYFVLGDNRIVSIDSRSESVGCVDERLVVGVVDDFVVQNRYNKFWKIVFRLI